MLLVTPFDKRLHKDIERVPNAFILGITHANDGAVIRLVIPALTEEKHVVLAKEVKKVGEKMQVAVRAITVAMLWTKLRSKKKQKKSLKTN